MVETLVIVAYDDEAKDNGHESARLGIWVMGDDESGCDWARKYRKRKSWEKEMINVVQVKTVEVSNVSLGASERDIKEFFSFSGDIEYVEMRSDTERSQIAYVTFKDSQGADTAVLLSVIIVLLIMVSESGWVFQLFHQVPSLHPPGYDYDASEGATIVDMSVTVTLDPVYQLPPAAFTASEPTEKKTAGNSESAFQKAEDVVSSMLAKGFILGKDAVGKAKSFDEKHKLTSTASAKVASLDQKIGLTEKISIGTSIVNEKVREVDQKLQVSDKARSAYSAAEQKVSSAGSAIMKNRYVLTGTTWVAGAFSKVAKAAGEVGQMTKEKVVMTEDEQRQKMVTDFAQVHLSESPKASDFTEHQSAKPAPAQGLVL
ncbi:hypothetical protein RND71_012577 [Anisodus tanguticus]|uniref:RRM domain-containing protein n=1 Tax=Anisodus tanguticus TaxID=243964 RepID=A0AAE1VQU5_9SOLA|nr:hypothetical protein RND71_012577 [Anisodus tanguticus]